MSSSTGEQQQEQQIAQPQQTSQLLTKLIAIVLGAGAAFAMYYFSRYLFDYAYSWWNQVPPDATLPPVLQGINPVIWKEASRLTGGGANLGR